MKKGELGYITEVQPVLESLGEEVMLLAETSDYPDTADREFWSDLVEDYHESIVKAG